MADLPEIARDVVPEFAPDFQQVARNEVASEFLPWLWDRIAEDPRGTYQSLAAATSPGRSGPSELLVGRSLAVPPDARQWTRVGGRTQLAMDTVDRTSEFLC